MTRPPVHIRITALVLLSFIGAMFWIGVWTVVEWVF